MATGKTHSKWVTITLNSTLVTCSLDNVSGIGITFEQTDITTLCNDIMENIQGQGDVNLSLAGKFDNGTNGSFTVAEPLNASGALTTLDIGIGIGAAPTTGDPEFQMTNVVVFNYLVAAANGSPVTDAFVVRGGEGVTADWGTVT